MNTKEQIINCSLTLFAQRGYDAVSVEQIAKEVGIKAPSLYKHFKSKQAIFDAIFIEMEKKYNEQIKMMKLHLQDGKEDIHLFKGITDDELVNKVQELIYYSIHDETVSKFRKLLTIEQFRNKEFASLYTQRYFTTLITYHQQLFDQLIQINQLVHEDSLILALQYISPICTLLSLCDREPNQEKEVLQLIDQHVRLFKKYYGV